MSIAYCSDCERVVEGSTIHGCEFSIPIMGKGPTKERRYELCPFCSQETTDLPEDNPEEDR